MPIFFVLLENDTEQDFRASFDRESGATWAGGRDLPRAARAGGAARRAGQCAEYRWARDSGLTGLGVAFLAFRSGPANWSQAAGTTAEGNSFGWSRVWTGWPECSDKARQGNCRQQGIRAWRLGFRTNRLAAPAAPERRAAGGWTGLPERSRHEVHRLGERSHQ